MQIQQKATRFLSRELDTFWAQFSYDCAVLSRKFPQLQAERSVRADKSCGLWTVKGPYPGVKAFCDLAAAAAEKLGFRGSRGAAVQWFLDEMHGDHIYRPAAKDRYAKDNTYSVATLSDGSKQGFVGRQKVAY